MNELIIDLSYEEADSDLFKYYYTSYPNEYTQYFTTQISSWEYNDDWPYGTGDVFLNPSRNFATDPIATVWASRNIANSWLMFRFNNISLKLKHYTMKQHSLGNDNLFKKWKVECSMNGKTWIEVDKQEIEDSNFVTKSGSRTFETRVQKIAKYIKITQTGKNNSGNDFFVIGDLKFYGEVYNSPEIDFTCNYKRTPHTYCMIVIIIVSLTKN